MTEPPQPQIQEEPEARQQATERGEREAEIYVASQWKLVWWRFRKHRLAVVGTVIVILIYLIALFAEFVAPFTPDAFDADYTYAPPQRLHFFDEDGLGLYVYGYSTKLNEETLVRTFEVDESKKVPVRLFAHGNTYKMWGLFETDLHLLGPVEKGEPMYLLRDNDHPLPDRLDGFGQGRQGALPFIARRGLRHGGRARRLKQAAHHPAA